MKRSFQKSNSFFRKVSACIPLASQTFSKSYVQYVHGASPLFITHGKGAYVWDIDGNKYIDFVNSLLAVTLGYQYPAVDRSIKRQLMKGNIFSLPSPLEYELSSLLTKHIPSAEMVRFGKNGSDVTSAGIRVARAHTGREHIAICGYHAWHDWYIGTTSRDLGVPQSTKSLSHTFTYNDIASLQNIFKKYKDKVAAVIMEPMNYIEPKKGFLEAVKRVTHQNRALLIFDEIITGFRFSLGGAQKLFGVIPDLATFGKGMANGMPMSALVGKRKYMKIVEDIHFSSTFGGETLSIAAAITTIKEIEKKRVIPYLWRLGRILERGVNRLIKAHGLESIMVLSGKPCWQVFIIKNQGTVSELVIKSFIQQELLARGFLWYGQHNLSFSHTTKEINALLSAYREVFPQLKSHLMNGTLEKALKGKPITNIFKVR